MNNKKTTIASAAGVSMILSVFIFIAFYFSASFVLPRHMFETSQYYVVAIFLELIPLSIGVIAYLILTKQGISDIIVFSKPQAKMNRDKMFWLVVLAAVMAIVGNYFVKILLVGWTWFLETVGYRVSEASLPTVDNFQVFIVALVSIALVPAIFEEMIFRGILQKGILRNAKPRTAILISSVLFMLMHLSVESMPFTFIMGCILGYLAYRTGSIIPSMMLHFVNNSIAVISLYVLELNKMNNPLLEEVKDISEFNSFEIMIVLIIAGISACLLALTLWGYKKLSKAPPENPYLQPMKPTAVTLIVMSGCILAFVTAFISILQNIFLA
ncbi:MAG: type II CAAX endopeptidase family protein [Eubacteriales bacterium]